MTITIFSDSFTGSGSLNGHAPDTPLGTEVWENSPDGLNISGGYAVSANTTIGGPGGSASTGDGTGPYTDPLLTGTISFSFRTGADVSFTAGRLGATVAAQINGLWFVMQIKCDATSSWVISNGTTDVPVTITANTTYAGTLDIADIAQTFLLCDTGISTYNAFIDSSGCTQLAASIGDEFGIGPLGIDYVSGVIHGSSSLSAPSPTTAIFSGAAADLIAVRPTIFAKDGGYSRLTAPSPTIQAYFGGSSEVTAPRPTMSATASKSYNNLIISAPSPMLDAYGGARSALTVPSPSISSTATSTIFVSAALSAPSPTLDAHAVVSATANVSLTAPSPNAKSYGGAVCSITLAGAPTVSATGTTGAVGHAAVTVPMFQITASATEQNHGSANLVVPMPRMGASIQAYTVVPMATLTAIGTATITATYEAYALNLNHNDPAAVDEMTRYTNFPFTHVVRYKNSYFGVNETGLYLLEGTTDYAEPAPTAIPWAFKTATTDFKSPFIKTVVSTYFAGRMGPEAAIDLYVGEDGAKTYSYQTPRTSTAKNFRQKFGRGNDARYYALGASGDGELALDEIQFNTLNHTRRI